MGSPAGSCAKASSPPEICGRRQMRLHRGCALFIAAALWAQKPAADPSFFWTSVYPVLETAQCRSCHTRDGVASATRLHFPEKDATGNQIQVFGLSLSPLVQRDRP